MRSVRELPAPWPGPKLWVLRWLAVMTVGGRSLWTAGGRGGGGRDGALLRPHLMQGPLFEEPRASPAVSLPMQVIIHLNCHHLPSSEQRPIVPLPLEFLHNSGALLRTRLMRVEQTVSPGIIRPSTTTCFSDQPSIYASLE